MARDRAREGVVLYAGDETPSAGVAALTIRPRTSNHGAILPRQVADRPRPGWPDTLVSLSGHTPIARRLSVISAPACGALSIADRVDRTASIPEGSVGCARGGSGRGSRSRLAANGH